MILFGYNFLLKKLEHSLIRKTLSVVNGNQIKASRLLGLNRNTLRKKINELNNQHIMEKNLYIDASHPNETRVVLKSGENIEDYEYEGLKNNLIKNNIYLGKVSRIEPSLQAAFVDFGRERHGFLSFNDIQSDYYQIPKADLEKIKEEEEKAREELSKQVEAKEEENIAEGKLEIDDPIAVSYTHLTLPTNREV